jgi:hypothetical protein
MTGTDRTGRTVRTDAARKAMLACVLLLLPAFPALPSFPPVHAQHAAFRVKGRVTNEKGEPLANAEVHAEAFFGYAAGTFSGPRRLSAQANAKGEWSIGAMQPGIWLFEVFAPNYMPETIALPIRILTTVSMGTSGMALTWDLILKPQHPPDDASGKMVVDALEAARSGKSDVVRSAFSQIPDNPTSEFLAGAGRVAIATRDLPLAQALFKRALDADPSSYRAAMGVASIFLLQRDFDSASRAFDATRSRTHDKDEQKFLTAAIGDLATIKVR